MSKFSANVARDRLQKTALEQQGWRVFVVWECQAADELALDHLVWSILASD
jgi:G:T-mismatch repair DNA endonuclease (very short patch repair protein)